MRRFYSSALISAIALVGGNSVKADITVPSGTDIIESSSGTISSGLVHTFTSDFSCSSNTVNSQNTGYGVYENRGCINAIIEEIDTQSSDITNNNTNITTNTSNISSNDNDIATNAANISTLSSNNSTNTSNFTTNRNNINTLGEGVANATALTAALTALPQASTDSKLSCGIGTGAYSSSYALGVGCVSKVNDKVNINFGGSYIGGGSKDYGSGELDNVAAKAGFIFTLGKIQKPTLISMKEKKALETNIENLTSRNKSIETKNKELENRLALQNERLEKLEQIALGLTKSTDLASIAP